MSLVVEWQYLTPAERDCLETIGNALPPNSIHPGIAMRILARHLVLERLAKREANRRLVKLKGKTVRAKGQLP